MPFTPDNFIDYPNTTTPITAAKLNNIEQGIVAADITTVGSAAALALAAAYLAKPSNVVNPITGWYHIDNFGADLTGTAASDAAIAAAIAAMPTFAVYPIPNMTGTQTASGTPTNFPRGTLYLPAGTIRINTSVANFGPLVSIIGAGSNSTTVKFYGTGDCFRVFNSVFPSDDNFDTIAAWMGTVNGFTIDGTNISGAARGLHYGDMEGGSLGPDLFIRNFASGQMQPTVLTLGTTNTTGGTFAAATYYWRVTATGAGGETVASNRVNATLALNGSQVLSWTAVTNATGYNVYRTTNSNNTGTLVAQPGNVLTFTDLGATINTNVPPISNVCGSIGLWLDNSVSWTENIYGRVEVYNCDNAVIIDHTTAAAGDWSFGYNDFTFKVYCYPNQQGIVIRGGAGLYNSSLKVRANMAMNTATATNSLLSLVGTTGADGTGTVSQIAYSRLDIQGETNIGGGNAPRSIFFGSPYTGGNAIYYCTGVMRFFKTWITSNWSASGANSPNFQFVGVVSGDVALQVGGGGNSSGPMPALVVSGQLGYQQSPGYYSGANMTLQMQVGDVFTCTLTQNSTIAFATTIAGPARKTVIVKQNATGGFTLAWPKPGSPTVAAPTVLWPGGTAPVMSAGVSAVDVYELVTYDGVTWYGSVRAAVA